MRRSRSRWTSLRRCPRIGEWTAGPALRWFPISSAEFGRWANLSSSSSGGVIVTCGRGKIWMDNTFERRLELLKEESMPRVVETLFGQNPNRKFFD